MKSPTSMFSPTTWGLMSSTSRWSSVPRYIPGAPISEKPQVPKALEGKVGEVKGGVRKVTLGPDPSGTGWSPDTTRGARCVSYHTPGSQTRLPQRETTSVFLCRLMRGVPVQDIEIVNHAAALQRIDASKATVEISEMDAIPNKDFVLKYKVVGEKTGDGGFLHTPLDRSNAISCS